jgi:hypothetical protein
MPEAAPVAALRPRMTRIASSASHATLTLRRVKAKLTSLTQADVASAIGGVSGIGHSISLVQVTSQRNCFRYRGVLVYGTEWRLG